MERQREPIEATPHPLRRAVASLVMLLAPAGALADDLRIEELSIQAKAGLLMTSGTNGMPFAYDQQLAANPTALLAPPAVAATARDGLPGLSFVSAQQANSAFYTDRISVVNDYPEGTPYLNPGEVTYFEAESSTRYALSVSALVPDVPLDLGVLVNSARLRAEDYYGAGRFDLALAIQLEIGFDHGPLQTVWQHGAILSLATPAAGGPAFGFQTVLVDPQGIGQPAWTFTPQQIFFLLGAQATTPTFTGHLDFGLLQPGHSFQLVYTSNLVGRGTLRYPGPGSFIDMELIDPLTLGGAAPTAPVTLAGLTLPAAVPEPAAWQLLVLGLAPLAWRRRRPGFPSATGAVSPGLVQPQGE